MPSPCHITWWVLRDQDLPLFAKEANEPVWIIGEEGENIMEIRRPTRVIAPLFELLANDTQSIHNQIQVRLEALVECGQVEGSEGALYGTIRTHLGSRGEWVKVTISLVFSNHELEPYFRERSDPSYRRLSTTDCDMWDLPIYEGPPPPPEPPPKRISRYERKPVI